MKTQIEKETELLKKLKDAVEGLLTPELCPLHRNTPYIICHVSQTQFSIARYYGGCDYNKEHYTYFATSDELWRDDFLKWAKKKSKEKK